MLGSLTCLALILTLVFITSIAAGDDRPALHALLHVTAFLLTPNTILQNVEWTCSIGSRISLNLPSRPHILHGVVQ